MGHVAGMQLLSSLAETPHLAEVEVPLRETVRQVVATLRHLNSGLGRGTGLTCRVKAALVAYVNLLAAAGHTTWLKEEGVIDVLVSWLGGRGVGLDVGRCA